MKIIRISDELHTKLKEHAVIDRRTINAEAEIIFQLYFADAEGGLTTEQVVDKQIKEALTVKKHIVQEGKDLGILPTPEKIASEPAAKVETDVSDLIRDITSDSVRKQLDTKEFACCKNEITPCKHWAWDSQTGEGYKNSLSGRFMEVDG